MSSNNCSSPTYSHTSLAFDICALRDSSASDGNSSVIANLATGLYKLSSKQNFKLHLYALRSQVLKEVPESSVTRVFGSQTSIPAHRLVRYCLPLNLLKDRPKVFINIGGGYQPRYIPSKQISIVHDIAFELDEWKSHYTEELRSFLSINTRLAVERADRVVAVSNRTREDLINFYGLPPNKVVVVYNGYDRKRFTPVHEEGDVAILRKTGPHPYFLSVGTLQPRKNYVRLIKAFAAVKRSRNIPHKLIIVGAEGWLADETIEVAKRHERDDVILWGRANSQELPALYRNAFAMIFPALYEGFGIPAVEAMACGIPVLGAETGSLGEIIDDFGLRFSPYSIDSIADAIKLVLDDEDLATEFRKKSLLRAQDFSWEKSAHEYYELAGCVAGE